MILECFELSLFEISIKRSGSCCWIFTLVNKLLLQLVIVFLHQMQPRQVSLYILKVGGYKSERSTLYTIQHNFLESYFIASIDYLPI